MFHEQSAIIMQYVVSRSQPVRVGRNFNNAGIFSAYLYIGMKRVLSVRFGRNDVIDLTPPRTRMQNEDREVRSWSGRRRGGDGATALSSKRYCTFTTVLRVHWGNNSEPSCATLDLVLTRRFVYEGCCRRLL